MITVTIPGLAELRQKVEAIEERTQNLSPALLRSGLVVLKAAADRIDSGGPGWAPNVTGTPLLHQTGRLLASLTVGASGSIDRQDEHTIMVGTNVKYAAWLQQGTGIFGPSGEPITAKNGNALSFMLGGKRVTVKSVKGVPPRPFLFVDQNVAERVRDVFATYLLGSDFVAIDETP